MPKTISIWSVMAAQPPPKQRLFPQREPVR
jgi:hypothetical protein